MKFKILVLGVLAIVIVVLLFTLLKEEVKVPNVNEAFVLLKENYSADISDNYSVINITNGWKFEFIKIEGNCSLECIKRYIYFEVYKNGSIMRSENSTNVTIIENENDALNYVLYRFPEFKNIGKCEFEEKLMCHEDVIIEEVNKGWNITFMNESKGCNNECVIRRYYSFFVEKDGKIRKDVSEKKISLEDIFEKDTVYPERKPGELGLGGTRTGKWLQFDGIINTIERNNSIYLKLYIPATNTTYVTKNGKKVYNILTEKFSTKTINNESDVLEAFKRYLKVFTRYMNGYGGILTGEENVSKLRFGWIIQAKYKYNFSLSEHKPVIVKKDDFWKLNCSVWYFHWYHDVAVIKYTVKVSNKGSINILDKKEYLYKDVKAYYY